MLFWMASHLTPTLCLQIGVEFFAKPGEADEDLKVYPGQGEGLTRVEGDLGQKGFLRILLLGRDLGCIEISEDNYVCCSQHL